jgi:hypothetical protein
MPDFDTRTRQEQNQPNRPRSLSIASRVRNLLIAMRLRTLLFGGGILLFVVVAVPVGVLIYSSSGLAAETVTCDQWLLGKTGECSSPGASGGVVEVCKADSRAEVYNGTPCREPPSSDPLVCTGHVCFPDSFSDPMESCRSFQQANGGPRCRQTGFLSFLVRKLYWAVWLSL